MIFEYENLGQPFFTAHVFPAIYVFPSHLHLPNVLWTMNPLKYSGEKNSFDLVPVLFGGIPALYHLEKEERTD